MWAFLKSLWVRDPDQLPRRVVRLVKSDQANQLLPLLTPELVSRGTVVEETFTQVTERQEATILVREHKKLLALAIDCNSVNTIRRLRDLVQDTASVCMRETFVVQGLVSQRQLERTGFKSVQREELSLESYFQHWARKHGAVLVSNGSNRRQRRRKRACEATIAALQQTFDAKLNEFRRAYA